MSVNILVTALILAMLFFIISSLAMGLYYLVKDQGRGKRTVRALTWRIGLSLFLFFLLMLLFMFGIISPHPLMGVPQSATVPTSNVEKNSYSQ